MSKNVTQLTESTTISGEDVFHFVDIANNIDKKIKASNSWNSKPYGDIFLNNNATATSIAAAGSWYNIATGGVVTSAGLTNYFTHDSANCRMTYTGEEDVIFDLSAVLSCISASGYLDFHFAIAINGSIVTKSEQRSLIADDEYYQAVVGCLTQLSKNDYIEIFVKNPDTTANITVLDLNFNAKAL